MTGCPAFRWLVRASCGLLTALPVCGCVDIFTNSAVPENLSREERLKLGAGAFLKNQCEKQWALLWPLARDGDGTALAVLAYEQYLKGLVLPGADAETDPMTKRAANALVAAIYGSIAPKHANKGALPILLAEYKRK